MKTNYQIPDELINDPEIHNQLLHLSLINAGEWIMLEAPGGNLSFIYGAFTEITGYHISEFIESKKFRSIILSDDREKYVKQLKNESADQCVYHLNFRIRTSEGNLQMIDHRAEALFDSSGAFIGWLSVNKKTETDDIALLAKVFENMNEAVLVGDIICDADGSPADYRIVMLNKAHEMLTGIQNEKLLGKLVLEVYPEFDKKWVRLFGEVAISGNPIRFEDYDPNTRRHYSLSCYQTMKGQFAVTFTDISDRRKMQAKLQKSEQMYQSIVNTQKELICRFKPDTTLVFVNSAFCRAFRKPKEKLLGTKLLNLISTDYHQYLLDHIQISISESGVKRKNYEVLLPGKKDKWYEWSSYTFRSNVSNDTEILAIGYDITEQFNVETRLLETVRRFDMISEHSHAVYWEVDVDGLIRYVSQGCKKIYGYYAYELEGKKHFYDLHPEEGREEFKQQAFKYFEERKVFEDFYNKSETKDGRIIWLSTNGIPVFNKKGEFVGYRGSDTDITTRKKQQDIIRENMDQINNYQSKLQRLNLALAESEENVKRDIAQFLHDNLGQVLSAIHIQLSFMNEFEPQQPSNQTLANIKEQVHSAITDCRELTYELSPPVLKKYGINEAVKWKLNEVEKNHGLTTQFESNIEKLEIDEKIMLMLFRIVAELINNVVKHAQANNLLVDIKLVDGELKFTVHDDGKGFDFDYQKDLSRRNSFGLFNISERVSFLGGKLSIGKSDKNSGTVASFMIPYQQFSPEFVKK